MSFFRKHASKLEQLASCYQEIEEQIQILYHHRLENLFLNPGSLVKLHQAIESNNYFSVTDKETLKCVMGKQLPVFSADNMDGMEIVAKCLLANQEASKSQQANFLQHLKSNSKEFIAVEMLFDEFNSLIDSIRKEQLRSFVAADYTQANQIAFGRNMLATVKLFSSRSPYGSCVADSNGLDENGKPKHPIFIQLDEKGVKSIRMDLSNHPNSAQGFADAILAAQGKDPYFATTALNIRSETPKVAQGPQMREPSIQVIVENIAIICAQDRTREIDFMKEIFIAALATDVNPNCLSFSSSDNKPWEASLVNQAKVEAMEAIKAWNVQRANRLASNPVDKENTKAFSL
jgi:hypothetical protein